MKVDNFKLIEKYLKFNNEDTFYYLQIIRRKKDTGNNEYKSTKTIKTYYISNLDYYYKIEDEVKKLCELFNARAYINLNSKSYKMCALRALKHISDDLCEENYKKIVRIPDTVAGKYFDKQTINWIVDIDTEEDLSNIDMIISDINNMKPFNSFKGVIPTVNGKHIITERFDLNSFCKLYPNIDIHKNNPTILYYDK